MADIFTKQVYVVEKVCISIH